MSHGPKPEIDFSKLSLPSDTVTVRDIRRHDAAVFEGEHHGMGGRLDDLSTLHALGIEMDLAELAFARQAGFTGLAYGELTRDDLVNDLLKVYDRLGIGDGERSRHELIRRFEADAAAQVQSIRGRET